MSVKARSASCAAGATCSRRDALRSGSGSWAISSWRQIEIEIGQRIHAVRWVSERAWNCYGYRFAKQAAEAYAKAKTRYFTLCRAFSPMPATKQVPAKSSKPAKPAKAASRLEDRLARLGLSTDMDLVLHLPMRYEDETEVVANPRGRPAWRPARRRSKASSPRTRSQYRPRRQLVVTIADDVRRR